MRCSAVHPVHAREGQGIAQSAQTTKPLGHPAPPTDPVRVAPGRVPQGLEPPAHATTDTHCCRYATLTLSTLSNKCPASPAVQILYGSRLDAGKKAWNYFVAILGATCTVFGTTASMKSLAAKAAAAAAGA